METRKYLQVDERGRCEARILSLLFAKARGVLPYVRIRKLEIDLPGLGTCKIHVQL